MRTVVDRSGRRVPSGDMDVVPSGMDIVPSGGLDLSPAMMTILGFLGGVAAGATGMHFAHKNKWLGMGTTTGAGKVQISQY